MCSCPSINYQQADFSIPATNQSCLDSSAARHKMALNPRKQKKKIVLVQKSRQEESIPSLISEEEKSTARTKEAIQRKSKKGPLSKEQNKSDTCDQKMMDQAANLAVPGNQVHPIVGGKRCRRKPTLEYGLRRDRVPIVLHDASNRSENEFLLRHQPLEKQSLELRSHKGDMAKGIAKASSEGRRVSEPQFLSGDMEFMSSDLPQYHQDEASGGKKKEVNIPVLSLAERLPTTQEQNMLLRAADTKLLKSTSDNAEEKGASGLNAQYKRERAQSVPTSYKEKSHGNVLQLFTVDVPGVTSSSPDGGMSTERLPPESLPQSLEATRVGKDSTNQKSNSEGNSSEEKQIPGQHLQSLWKTKVFSTAENATREFSNFEKKAALGYSSKFMRKPKDDMVSQLDTISEVDSSYEQGVSSLSYQSVGKPGQGISQSKDFHVTHILKDHLIPRPAFEILQDKDIMMESSYVEKYNSAEDMSTSEEDLAVNPVDKTLKKSPEQAVTSTSSKKIPKQDYNVPGKTIPPQYPSQPVKRNIIQQRSPVNKLAHSHSFHSDLEKVAVEWSLIMEQPMAPKAPPKRPRKRMEPKVSTQEITNEREVFPSYISPPIPQAKSITKQGGSASVKSTPVEGSVLMKCSKWPPQPTAKPLVKKELFLGAESTVMERRVSMESLLPKCSSVRPFTQQKMSVASRSASVEGCITADLRPPGHTFQSWLTRPVERQVSMFPENKAVEKGMSMESLPAKIPPKPPKKPKIHTTKMMSLEGAAAEDIVSVDYPKSSSQILPSPAAQKISPRSSVAEEPIFMKPLSARYPPESSGRPNLRSEMIRDTGSTSTPWTCHMEPKPANHTLKARMNRRFKQQISLCPENDEVKGNTAMETRASRRHSRPWLISPFQPVSESLENIIVELDNSMGSPSPRTPSQSGMRSANKPPVSSGTLSPSAQWSSGVESKPLKDPLQAGMDTSFKQLSACLETSATQTSTFMEVRPRRHHSQPPMRPKIKADMSSAWMATSAEWSGPVKPVSPRVLHQPRMSQKSEPQVSQDAETLDRMCRFTKELGFPREYSPSVGKHYGPKVMSSLESLEEFIHGNLAPLKHPSPFSRRSKVKEISSRLQHSMVEDNFVRKTQVHRDPSQSFVKFMAQQIFSEIPSVEEKMGLDPVASKHHSKSLLKQQVFSDWGNAAPERSNSLKKPRMKNQLQSLARREDPQEVYSGPTSVLVKRSMSKRYLPARKISKATGKLDYKPDKSVSINFPEEWRSPDEQLLSPYSFQAWKVSEMWPPTAASSSESGSGEQSKKEDILPPRNVFKPSGNTESWQQVSTSFRSATFEKSGNWFLQKTQPKKVKRRSQSPEDLLKNIMIPSDKPGKFIVVPSQTMHIHSNEDSLPCDNDNHSYFPTNEMDDVESIFGVRLRKTHASGKCQSEKQDPINQLPLQPLGPTLFSPDKEPKTRRNASPKRLDTLDNFEPRPNSAEKEQSKPKSESLVKKQPVCKTPGKPPGQPSDLATPEPDWITMAKQKQRNFPSSLPMKELKVNNTAEDEAETNKPKYKESSSGNEIQLKKILNSSLHKQEAGPLKPAKSVAFEDEYTSTKKETKRSLSLPARLQWPDDPEEESDANEPAWFSLAKKKARAWSHMAEVMY
ncbi:acrosomal protein KIAA1210 homolog [Thomomys bottae]